MVRPKVQPVQTPSRPKSNRLKVNQLKKAKLDSNVAQSVQETTPSRQKSTRLRIKSKQSENQLNGALSQSVMPKSRLKNKRLRAHPSKAVISLSDTQNVVPTVPDPTTVIPTPSLSPVPPASTDHVFAVPALPPPRSRRPKVRRIPRPSKDDWNDIMEVISQDLEEKAEEERINYMDCEEFQFEDPTLTSFAFAAIAPSFHKDFEVPKDGVIPPHFISTDDCPYGLTRYFGPKRILAAKRDLERRVNLQRELKEKSEKGEVLNEMERIFISEKSSLESDLKRFSDTNKQWLETAEEIEKKEEEERLRRKVEEESVENGEEKEESEKVEMAQMKMTKDEEEKKVEEVEKNEEKKEINKETVVDSAIRRRQFEQSRVRVELRRLKDKMRRELTKRNKIESLPQTKETVKALLTLDKTEKEILIKRKEFMKELEELNDLQMVQVREQREGKVQKKREGEVKKKESVNEEEKPKTHSISWMTSAFIHDHPYSCVRGRSYVKFSKREQEKSNGVIQPQFIHHGISLDDAKPSVVLPVKSFIKKELDSEKIEEKEKQSLKRKFYTTSEEESTPARGSYSLHNHPITRPNIAPNHIVRISRPSALPINRVNLTQPIRPPTKQVSHAVRPWKRQAIDYSHLIVEKKVKMILNREAPLYPVATLPNTRPPQLRENFTNLGNQPNVEPKKPKLPKRVKMVLAKRSEQGPISVANENLSEALPVHSSAAIDKTINEVLGKEETVTVSIERTTTTKIGDKPSPSPPVKSGSDKPQTSFQSFASCEEFLEEMDVEAECDILTTPSDGFDIINFADSEDEDFSLLELLPTENSEKNSANGKEENPPGPHSSRKDKILIQLLQEDNSQIGRVGPPFTPLSISPSIETFSSSIHTISSSPSGVDRLSGLPVSTPFFSPPTRESSPNETLTSIPEKLLVKTNDACFNKYHHSPALSTSSPLSTESTDSSDQLISSPSFASFKGVSV